MQMKKSRIEAFSDGVIAIIITVMMLDIKIPNGPHLSDLIQLHSIAFCYLLSFVYLAIYWNNHHHLFQTADEVNGKILWANIHLLFWLTLFPFTTTWAGESHFANVPTILYGAILFMAACAYSILTKTLIAHHGQKSTLAVAIGNDKKGKLSILLYAIGMIAAYWFPLVGFSLYIFVAILWFIPDKRIENVKL